MSTPNMPRMTVPTVPTITVQQVNFAPVLRSHTMLNSRPVAMETMFNNNMMTVPPCHVIHGMRPDGRLEPWSKTDVDADGDPIPGSYVVEDRYEPDIAGGTVLAMSADQAVKTIFGIIRRPDGSAAELTSKRALLGLSLLPRHPTKAVWQEAARLGGDRAFLTSVAQAEYTIEAYRHRNALDRAAGMPSAPVGPDLQHAIAVVNQFKALATQDSDAMLAPFRAVEEATSAASSLEFEAFLKARLMKLAESNAAAVGLDKKKVFDNMMQDPEIRKHAQQEWRYRRKGHEPIPAEDLDAASELGQGVKEAGLE